MIQEIKNWLWRYSMNFNPNDLAHPIDVNFLELVKVIDGETKSNYFLIGASSRDLTFHNIYGLDLSARATGDIDFAVCVENWAQYKSLKNRLIEIHGCTDSVDQEQRILSPNGVPIDLIPFGAVSSADLIHWPNSDSVMSVACYENAKEKSNVILYDDFQLNLVSIEMFVSLKLVAWDSRKANKDLNDIVYVIENYPLIPSVEEQITKLGFDQKFDNISYMSAAVLAYNMKSSLESDSLLVIKTIFVKGMNPQNRMPLIRKMQKSLPPHSFPGTKKFIEKFYEELIE